MENKKKRAANGSLDQYRMEYLHTDITLKDLMEKYGLSTALYTKAFKEGWESEKRKIKERLHQESSDLMIKIRAAQLVELNKIDLSICHDIRKQIQNHISSKPLLSTRDLRTLASTLKEAQLVSRIALGLGQFDIKEETDVSKVIKIINGLEPNARDHASEII